MYKAVRVFIVCGLWLCVQGCGRKALQKDNTPETRLEAVEPFFQQVVPGMEDGEVSINLLLPLRVDPPEVQVDSIYFRGWKQKLRETTAADQRVFKATIHTRGGEKATPPVELQPNEALIVYRYRGQRHLFKVTGMKEKEALYAP